jgi:hypothetical protein
MVQDWKHGRVNDLDDRAPMCNTAFDLVQTGQQKIPLGINFLDELPSPKYQSKLKKAWTWCKSFASELSLSSYPARQPSMPSPAQPDWKPMPKPEGVCTNWDLRN